MVSPCLLEEAWADQSSRNMQQVRRRVGAPRPFKGTVSILVVPADHFQGPYCGAARRLSAESEDLRWLRLCTTEKLSLDALIWKYKEAQIWGTLQVHSPPISKKRHGQVVLSTSLRTKRCHNKEHWAASSPTLFEMWSKMHPSQALQLINAFAMLSTVEKTVFETELSRSTVGSLPPSFVLRSWRVSTRARSKLVGSAKWFASTRRTSQSGNATLRASLVERRLVRTGTPTICSHRTL